MAVALFTSKNKTVFPLVYIYCVCWIVVSLALRVLKLKVIKVGMIEKSILSFSPNKKSL